MRVLVDTNILVSALLRDGKPEAAILWILAQPDWEWIASPAILAEYQAVIRRKKFNFEPDFVQRWTDLFEAAVTLCEPNIAVEFLRDRNDAKFLECAQFGGADVLMTGDADFSDAQNLTDALIVSPSDFARLFMEAPE